MYMFTYIVLSPDVLLSLQEAGRRYLQFTVPRVVAVSPQMRLVEDNTANISLADIFKQVCNLMTY